ncbi:MAG: DUF3368 domain-containing protein [Candidatus Delongbacteria bacterium]|nr:DUF3368 domain-containing protein [Candidatus Delongbacteria bacterium]
MLIVADSSPLISLAIIERLGLIKELFTEFFVPEEVYQELTLRNKAYNELFVSFLSHHTKKVHNPMALTGLDMVIDKGEAEAIILALENKIPNILIDDLKGRRVAKLSSLNVIGTLGVLLQAKKKGLLTSIKMDMDKLVDHSIYISENLYKKVLNLANEDL